jgi:hypothetical protein
MTKEIRFNAFAMNCTGHMAPGLWRHPKDHSDRYVDLNGFNLAYVVMPETYRDIIDLLIPELQRRGAYKKEYRPGTLREKLFRLGPYLPETHPGNNRALSSRESPPGRNS